MGFLSFNLNYYEHEIIKLENNEVTEETIYHAQQMLKMLDDFVDEQYFTLYNEVEKKFHGVSRLHDYLQKNGAMKCPVFSIESTSATYGTDDQEVSCAINKVIKKASRHNTSDESEIIIDLINFCEWIGYQKETAYVFLLRDALLPYIYYQELKRENIYPWVIGRKTMKQLTNVNNVDDEIREQIISALENNQCHSFKEFSDYTLPRIRNIVKNKYPVIEKTLLSLLQNIKAEKIIVIESGCYGTFPMLLMSLDTRIDMRMYTTVPYLLKAYEKRIYTHKYENNRLFETIYSQDLFFEYSRLENNLFYVKQTISADVSQKAYAEIHTIIEKAKKK